MWVWRRRGSCIGCRGNPSRVPRFGSLAAPLPVPLFPFPFSIFVCHPSPPVASHAAQRLLQCGGVVGRRHLLVQRMCSCWWGWSLHHVVVGLAWWCFRGSCGCLVALCWLLLPWVVGAEPGKGSLWASVLSGRGDLQPEQKRLREAKKGSGDEQESRREREGVGETTRASASTTAEAPQSILLSVPGFASAFSRTPCRAHGRHGHGHCRRSPAASTWVSAPAGHPSTRLLTHPEAQPADIRRKLPRYSSRTSASPSQGAWEAPPPRRPGLCSPSRPRSAKDCLRRCRTAPGMLPGLVGHLPLYRRDWAGCAQTCTGPFRACVVPAGGKLLLIGRSAAAAPALGLGGVEAHGTGAATRGRPKAGGTSTVGSCGGGSARRASSVICLVGLFPRPPVSSRPVNQTAGRRC